MLSTLTRPFVETSGSQNKLKKNKDYHQNSKRFSSFTQSTDKNHCANIDDVTIATTTLGSIIDDYDDNDDELFLINSNNNEKDESNNGSCSSNGCGEEDINEWIYISPIKCKGSKRIRTSVPLVTSNLLLLDNDNNITNDLSSSTTGDKSSKRSGRRRTTDGNSSSNNNNNNRDTSSGTRRNSLPRTDSWDIDNTDTIMAKLQSSFNNLMSSSNNNNNSCGDYSKSNMSVSNNSKNGLSLNNSKTLLSLNNNNSSINGISFNNSNNKNNNNHQNSSSKVVLSGNNSSKNGFSYNNNHDNNSISNGSNYSFCTDLEYIVLLNSPISTTKPVIQSNDFLFKETTNIDHNTSSINSLKQLINDGTAKTRTQVDPSENDDDNGGGDNDNILGMPKEEKHVVTNDDNDKENIIIDTKYNNNNNNDLGIVSTHIPQQQLIRERPIINEISFPSNFIQDELQQYFSITIRDYCNDESDPLLQINLEETILYTDTNDVLLVKSIQQQRPRLKSCIKNNIQNNPYMEAAKIRIQQKYNSQSLSLSSLSTMQKQPIFPIDTVVKKQRKVIFDIQNNTVDEYESYIDDDNIDEFFWNKDDMVSLKKEARKKVYLSTKIDQLLTNVPISSSCITDNNRPVTVGQYIQSFQDAENDTTWDSNYPTSNKTTIAIYDRTMLLRGLGLGYRGMEIFQPKLQRERRKRVQKIVTSIVEFYQRQVQFYNQNNNNNNNNKVVEQQQHNSYSSHRHCDSYNNIDTYDDYDSMDELSDDVVPTYDKHYNTTSRLVQMYAQPLTQNSRMWAHTIGLAEYISSSSSLLSSVSVSTAAVPISITTEQTTATPTMTTDTVIDVHQDRTNQLTMQEIFPNSIRGTIQSSNCNVDNRNKENNKVENCNNTNNTNINIVYKGHDQLVENAYNEKRNIKTSDINGRSTGNKHSEFIVNKICSNDESHDKTNIVQSSATYRPTRSRTTNTTSSFVSSSIGNNSTNNCNTTGDSGGSCFFDPIVTVDQRTGRRIIQALNPMEI